MKLDGQIHTSAALSRGETNRYPFCYEV